MSYEKLFTPFKIGKMEVKNRLVMSPMGTNSALANGRKTDNEIDYFIERAKGGVGMIIMGCQPLNEKIAQGSMEGYMDSFTVYLHLQVFVMEYINMVLKLYVN